MILTINPHGRTRRATRDLLAHLRKGDNGQIVDLVHVVGTPARSAAEALRDFERIRDGSDATIALQHVTINPGRPWTAAERDEAVIEILRTLGAEKHAYVLIAHRNKPRARGVAGDTHFHLVVAHVGPALRALDLRCSYIKLEAVRARLEVQFRESLTPSRRSDAIVTHLRRDGHRAVAALVEKDAATRSNLPRSGLTSRSRARLQRDGICAPTVRAAVIAAYQGSDTREAFEAALAQDGLSLEPGDHEGVRVVRKNGVLIGALDRLVDAPRATVMMRLKERSHNVEFDPETSRVEADVYEAITQAENQDHATASDQALQVWMHRLKCGLAAAEAAIEQASRRSPPPPSRKGELDLAQLVCRRAEEASRAAQKQVEQRRPEQLTGWQGLVSRAKAPFFRAKVRQDASLLAGAERDLERAESRKADADVELQRIAGEIAAETMAYKQRIAQEDEQARPQKREAEVRIAFYHDLRMLLEREPWLAVEDDAVLRSGVSRLRRARETCVWDEADTTGAEASASYEAPVSRPG